MRITKESEYALRILVCLARAGGLLDTGAVAMETSVPPRFTAKILRKLRTAKLVSASKGAAGGYRLAKPAAEITMLAAMEAIDGPIAITLCLAEDYNCAHHPDQSACGCFFHDIFDRINERIISELSSTTIAMAMGEGNTACRTACEHHCAGCVSGTCHKTGGENT